MNLRFKIIDTNHPDYAMIFNLRETILRIPLGFQFTKEEIAYDGMHLHVVAYLDDKIVATCMLVDGGEGILQIMRVAVSSQHQGKNIGKAMMRFCEQYAVKNNFNQILVHARESAAQFYLSLGYIVQGKPFIQSTIPHIKMIKYIIL